MSEASFFDGVFYFLMGAKYAAKGFSKVQEFTGKKINETEDIEEFYKATGHNIQTAVHKRVLSVIRVARDLPEPENVPMDIRREYTSFLKAMDRKKFFSSPDVKFYVDWRHTPE